MTARHFHAKLVESNNNISKYQYTPDAIAMKYYGVMEINFDSEEITIVDYAPEDPNWKWGKDYQEYSVKALAYKILKTYRDNRCVENEVLYIA